MVRKFALWALIAVVVLGGLSALGYFIYDKEQARREVHNEGNEGCEEQLVWSLRGVQFAQLWTGLALTANDAQLAAEIRDAQEALKMAGFSTFPGWSYGATNIYFSRYCSADSALDAGQAVYERVDAQLSVARSLVARNEHAAARAVLAVLFDEINFNANFHDLVFWMTASDYFDWQNVEEVSELISSPGFVDWVEQYAASSVKAERTK